MSSNNYNTYNYADYQQSAAQNYPTYQTAPAANSIAQPSRQQYQQQQLAPITTQPDYMSYASQTYNHQNNGYGGGQNNSWTGNKSSYGASRETTSRAAEVLRNMSNTAYAPNTSAAGSQSGFTATNATAAHNARYSNVSPAQQHAKSNVQPQSVYDQKTARPRSVNANRSQATTSTHGLPPPAATAAYHSQRNQNSYNAQQPQQRPSSPAQQTYGYGRTTPVSTVRSAANGRTTPVSTARSAAITVTSNYNDYGHRQLPSVDSSRSTPTVITTSSYTYPSSQVTAPTEQSSTPVAYQSNTVNTVDPMAVYDPWPEYQRKQEAIRAQKMAEEAVRVEEARKQAEKEDRLQEQERRRTEEVERKRAEEVERERAAEEERRRAEEEARAEEAAKQARQKKKTLQASVEETVATAPMHIAQPSSGGATPDLEAEIRAMMAKMRELNGKDPALLAKIWEEERRAKAPKSPTVPNATAQSTHAQTGPSTSQRNPPTAVAMSNSVAPKPIHKEATTPTPAIPSAVQSSTPAAARPTGSNAAAPKPIQRQTTVMTPATLSTAQSSTPAVARRTGNTIWPQEKIEELCRTATVYLNELNPTNQMTRDRILALLGGNPSYIELCELLEDMSLRLDRAVFAKKLLAAVPDINSTARAQAQSRMSSMQPPANQMNGTATQHTYVPPAVLTKAPAAAPVATVTSPHYTPVAQPSYPNNSGSASHSPVPIAEMVPINVEPKAPASKEEAARKRNFGDIIDLTSIDDEDAEPVPKKQNIGSLYSTSPGLAPGDAMEVDGEAATNGITKPTTVFPQPAPQPVEHLRLRNVVQTLDKRKALRRNSYNPATIARDVLLACGRHPEERQLNAHLDVLRSHLSSQVPIDADLSTLKWDLIDPGEPPKGYYKSSDQVLVEDADDEDESEEEGPRSIGAGAGVGDARTQLHLPEATNPFKRRGRAARHSFPGPRSNAHHDTTPYKYSASIANMSASAPRPSATAAGVGYSAFRSAADIESNGTPLTTTTKKGRPVGWRKSIHGSAAAQARSNANGHPGPSHSFTPSQPSALRNIQPIDITSRSPSAAPALRFQSFKCRWQNCKADLHNLETLKKHVQKLHRKQTLKGTLECLWNGCGKDNTIAEPTTGMQVEKHTPYAFTDESQWREHMEIRHFGPLSWELGDGPASGISDAHDSEAYLSDAQGRQVTPRITPYPLSSGMNSGDLALRGRRRPPKMTFPQTEAYEAMNRFIAQKKRLGGPGIDRGGATFVNEKRRRGFIDDSAAEDEFVDAES